MKTDLLLLTGTLGEYGCKLVNIYLIWISICYTSYKVLKVKLLSYYSQRISKQQWWMKLRPLLRILAKHDSTYEEEGMYMTVEQGEIDAEDVI